jgi:bis(5'-adenosyl)-triphosphatase
MAQDPFCGEGVYEEVFLETGHFLAIPNLHPVLPGHVLIVPKRHVIEITELGADEMADLRLMLERLLPTLLGEYKTDSYNLAINRGRAAGMSIAHLHVHVVPRHPGDAFQKEGLNAFYSTIESESSPLSKDFEGEIERMRRLFKYVPAAGRR